MPRNRKIGFALGIFVFALFLLIEDFDPANPRLNVMAAIAAFMAVLWVTEAIPLAVTSLFPLILYPVTGLLDAASVAVAYINSVIFLFLGGFLIAISMEEWGLHKRIALKLISVLGSSLASVVIGFILASAFLSMWISNTATVLMLLPIALAVITKLEEQFGEKEIHNFAVVLLISIAYSSTIGGVSTLVGTPPNLVFVKTFSILFPDSPVITFSNWMLVGLPVSVCMLTLMGIYMIYFNLRNGKNIIPDKKFVMQEYSKLGKMSFEEKIVSTVFCLTAILWVFRININLGFVEIPGWSNLLPASDLIDDGTVAIAMSFLFFVIPAKKKSRTILDQGAFAKVPWGVILLFGGGFALAEGFVSTGLSNFIGEQLSGLSSLSPFLIVIITAAMVSFLTELTSNTATSQIILPVVASVSVAVGMNPLILMLTATISASMAFMLPVATPPNTIIFASGRIRISELAKTGLILNIIGIVVISLLVYVWGSLIFDLNVFPDWAKLN